MKKNPKKTTLKSAPAAVAETPKIDLKAIEVVEDALAKLRSGELLNIAIVGERKGGEVMMAFVSQHTAPIRTRAGLMTLGPHIDLTILQANAQAAAAPPAAT